MEDEIWKMLVKSSVLVKLLFEGCVDDLYLNLHNLVIQLVIMLLKVLTWIHK
jgi:hypothetical protein